MSTIYWTAKNNNSFLNGYRNASSLRSAVRDARDYVRNELYGEGTISFFDAPPDDSARPIRKDERSIFTRHKWATHTREVE